MFVVYLAVGLMIMLVGFVVGGFLIATFMDWNYRRKNRLLIALTKDYNKRSRPVAK